MKARKHLQGFSLTELMIAVALFAIFLLVASPSIQLYLENSKVKNVAESIESGMQKAKFHAIKYNTPVEFVLDLTNSSWAIWQLDDSTTSAKQVTPAIETFSWGADGRNWSRVTVSANPTGVAHSSNLAVVTFDRGDGWLLRNNLTTTAAPPHSITVSNSLEGTRHLQVDILMKGGVRVCDQDLPEGDAKGCNFGEL
ncbi:MAG: GspH/FimT family pseudopilin [Betaproteobacteria bacterium]|nr:GspH/FimT family pseudopilin [Betaproteobacteria bacterium]